MRIEQRDMAPKPAAAPLPRPTSGRAKAPGEYTYEASVTVERMRAQRRMKLLTRAKRRAEQQGKKAIDRVRHSSDIEKKVTTLQRHEKKITGITKMRDMLGAFLDDTARAFASFKPSPTGALFGINAPDTVPWSARRKMAGVVLAPNGLAAGSTVYAAAESGAILARDLGNDELAAELDKHTGECVAITNGEFAGVVRDE
jgi:hypothetical protein